MLRKKNSVQIQIWTSGIWPWRPLDWQVWFPQLVSLCLYQGVQNFEQLCIFKVPHILFKCFLEEFQKIILDKMSNGQHRFIIIISCTVLKKNNPTILQSHNDRLVIGLSLLTITCPLCKQPLSVSVFDSSTDRCRHQHDREPGGPEGSQWRGSVCYHGAPGLCCG